VGDRINCSFPIHGKSTFSLQRYALSDKRDPGLHPLYSAYSLSYWHHEEMMEERGVPVDHSTIKRWAIRSDLCNKVFSQTNDIRLS
jgi:hypothetical protein